MFNPEDVLKPAVLNSQAYHVADASGLIKLDAMENPYVWPEEIQEEWLSCLKASSFNRYPSPNPQDLKQKISNLLGLNKQQAMLLGNGSDELIQILLMGLKSGSTVLTIEPSFVMYEMVASWLELDYKSVELNEDFSLPEERFIDAIKQFQPSIIFLAWPNNPTANIFSVATLHKVLEESKGMVIIDEAYHAFAKQTMVKEITNYPNLLVMRTFSKLGLAGLRFGFLLGSDVWINEFEKIRLPYNNGILTQTTLSFILDKIDVLEEQAERLVIARDNMIQELNTLSGIDVWPSAANFFLFRSHGLSAAEVHGALKQDGILVKNVSGTHNLLKDCLRISIGTEEENAQFMQALKKML